MPVKSAAIYVRISDDKADDAAGVARQEKDCRALAARQGWKVGQVYAENDTSAFARKSVRLPDGTTALRVVRPAFRRMLEDLAHGTCDALIGYDLDRVARDPRDLEDLIDVVEARRLPTRAVTGSLDLSTDAGVTMARVMVAVANKSSRDTARRVTRKQQELAEQGKHKGGGIRAFGYERDGLTVNKAEAKELRRMAQLLLGGKSLVALAKDLTERGVPTVTGKTFPDGSLRPWNSRSVHAAITKPRVAGLREYRGEVIGEAEWPAILDRDTWERVRMILAKRAEGHSTAARYWLRGVLLCSRCGHGLAGAQQGHGRTHRYWCATSEGGCGGIGVDGVGAEALAEGLLLAYLRRKDVLANLRAEVSASNVDSLRGDVAEDEAQLRELADLWANRQVTTKEYLAARTAIEQRLSSSKTLLRKAMPGAVRSLLEAKDVKRSWGALGVADKREVARVVFSEGIIVTPAREGVSRFAGFDPARLRPVGWEAS
jgi:DNA invertase Pin-like site-specific DNA recombinase